MVPHEDIQHDGIVHLLKHFGWTWVGVIVSDDDIGETFLRIFTARLLENNICVEFTEIIPTLRTSWGPNEFLFHTTERINSTLSLTRSNVILVNGDQRSMEALRRVLILNEYSLKKPIEKVWLITARWDFAAVIGLEVFTPKSFNGTLSFTLHTNSLPGYEDFLKAINPYESPLYEVQMFWSFAFRCVLLHYEYEMNMNNSIPCSGNEELGGLPGSVFEMQMSGQSYGIYNAVYSVAYALNAIFSPKLKQKALREGPAFSTLNIHPWEVRWI